MVTTGHGSGIIADCGHGGGQFMCYCTWCYDCSSPIVAGFDLRTLGGGDVVPLSGWVALGCTRNFAMSVAFAILFV